MSQEPRRYVDEYQNVHFLAGDAFDSGGQGEVYRTQDPDVAVKLIFGDEKGRPADAASMEKYQAPLREVRWLPLPEGLNISIPAALLRDNAGYVMQLLSEMTSFNKSFMSAATTAGDVPPWLDGMPDRAVKDILRYRETGGLRRRLIALYKGASLLARLHGAGLVYGDVSPNNLFISEKLEQTSVWLIDADNIRFEDASKSMGLHTPGYGAPELVQGKDGGRPACDCHAFAVLAFLLLALAHPFIGKKAEGTGEEDWADSDQGEGTPEDKAYKGYFPWIDDRYDDSNSSEAGLPRTIILTEKLRLLFEGTFSAGRTSPGLRPAIFHWPEALAQAADSAIICPGCRMSYYDDAFDDCPYCQAPKPGILRLEAYPWPGPGTPLGPPCWRLAREIEGDSAIALPERLFGAFSMIGSDTELVQLHISEKQVRLKKTDSAKKLFVALKAPRPSRFRPLSSSEPLKIARNSPDLHFWLFADSGRPRLVSCSICGEPR